jgi:hypothetical protein
MLALRSNVASVRGRLSRFRDRLPAAIATAVQPGRWRDRAAQTARDVLEALAEPAQLQFVDAFVRTVVSAAVPDGFSLSLRGESADSVLDRLGEFRATAELPLFDAAFASNRNEAYDVILAWVSSGAKNRDERDLDEDGNQKSDEEIAERIYEILFGRDDSPNRVAARQSLLKRDGKNPDPAHPHLVDFALSQQSGLTSALTPATVDTWLRAVLAAWKAMILHELPEAVRAAIRDAAAASGMGSGPVSEGAYHAARTAF